MQRNLVRIISQEDVKKCIDMKQAVELQKRAFLALSPGSKSVTPDRVLLSVPEEGITLFKPAYFQEEETGKQTSNGDIGRVLGCKVVSVRAKNSKIGLPTVPGSIMIFDAETGYTKALLNAEYLTGLRTAAGSGVFTDMYASKSAEKLVIFGAGLQGEEHFKAMITVRPSIKQVVVINRTLKRAEDLIEKVKSAYDIVFKSCALSNEQAVKEALQDVDIVCCCTNNGQTPLFRSDWVNPRKNRNVHINAIGSYLPTMQEIPDKVVARAVDTGIVVCDSHEAFNVGEFNATSSVEKDKIFVACDALAHASCNGGVGPKWDEKKLGKISIFKSVGTSIQDVVTGAAVFRNAEALNVGTVCAL